MSTPHDPSGDLPESAAELARRGDVDGLRAELARGLGADRRDGKGNTLLMIAAYHGHLAAVQLLLATGATVDLRNAKGQTPLGGAAFKGHVEVARALLDAGADPQADQGGSTPADYATMFGRHEILALLKERSAPAARPTRWFSKLIGWVRKS